MKLRFVMCSSAHVCEVEKCSRHRLNQLTPSHTWLTLSLSLACSLSCQSPELRCSLGKNGWVGKFEVWKIIRHLYRMRANVCKSMIEARREFSIRNEITFHSMTHVTHSSMNKVFCDLNNSTLLRQRKLFFREFSPHFRRVNIELNFPHPQLVLKCVCDVPLNWYRFVPSCCFQLSVPLCFGYVSFISGLWGGKSSWKAARIYRDSAR